MIFPLTIPVSPASFAPHKEQRIWMHLVIGTFGRMTDIPGYSNLFTAPGGPISNPRPMLLAILIIPLHIILSFGLATWAAQKKKIGFWWTFFFSLTLTPVTAFLQVLLSKDRNQPDSHSLFDFCLFLNLFVMSGLSAVFFVWKGIATRDITGCLWLVNGAGLWGACLYYLRLSVFGERSDDR